MSSCTVPWSAVRTEAGDDDGEVRTRVESARKTRDGGGTRETRESRRGEAGGKRKARGNGVMSTTSGPRACAHLGGELHDDAQSVRFGDEGFVVLDDVRRVELREDATLVDGLLLVRAPRAHGDLLDHERALARVALARHSPNHTEGTLAELAQDVEVGHARGVATGGHHLGRGAGGASTAKLVAALARTRIVVGETHVWRERARAAVATGGASDASVEARARSRGLARRSECARHAARTRARHHRRRARVVVVSGEPTVRVALTNDSFFARRGAEWTCAPFKSRIETERRSKLANVDPRVR